MKNKNAITIKLNGGLSEWGIDFIQVLEKIFDEGLNSQGFTRSTSTKSDEEIEFNYRQFARCI